MLGSSRSIAGNGWNFELIYEDDEIILAHRATK